MNLGQPRKKLNKPTNGFVAGWNCTGLSEQDMWKKHIEDESIEVNVQAMESNEGIDRNMVESKGN
jgi:hypothetical protein